MRRPIKVESHNPQVAEILQDYLESLEYNSNKIATTSWLRQQMELYTLHLHAASNEVCRHRQAEPEQKTYNYIVNRNAVYTISGSGAVSPDGVTIVNTCS